MTKKKVEVDRNKPLLSMSPREREEAFMIAGSGLDKGMLDEAREGLNREVQIVAAVLRTRDGSERIAMAFEEYGDETDVDLCEEMVVEMKPFLHADESLRVATYSVQLSSAFPFEFPSSLKIRTNGRVAVEKLEVLDAYRRYNRLRQARGELNVVVLWLVTPKGREVVTWNMDHGDGDGMFENTMPIVKSITWNKLLHKDESLEVIVYSVPQAALHELPTPA